MSDSQANNNSQANNSSNQSEAKTQHEESSTPPNKTPPAQPNQTTSRRFDGSDYIDEKDRAEFWKRWGSVLLGHVPVMLYGW